MKDIAATVVRRSRAAALDEIPMRLDETRGLADNSARSPQCRRVLRWYRLPSDAGRLAVIENEPEILDMVAGIAMPEQMGARGIGGQHAANRARHSTCWFRCKAPADGSQTCIQVRAGYPRLHTDKVGADFQDAAEMMAHVHDQARAQRFAGQASACPPRHQGQLMLGGIPDQILDVFFIARSDHAQRSHLKNAGVRGI